MTDVFDFMGFLIITGDLILLPTTQGRSPVLEFRIVSNISTRGVVQVQGLGTPGGSLASTRRATLNYPERTVVCLAHFADKHTKLVVAGKTYLSSFDMDTVHEVGKDHKAVFAGSGVVGVPTVVLTTLAGILASERWLEAYTLEQNARMGR